jgi:hypothetical protein
MPPFFRTFLLAFLSQSAVLLIIVFAFYVGGPGSGMIKGIMLFLATVWAILLGLFGIESMSGIFIFTFILIFLTSMFASWYSTRITKSG